MEDLEDKMDGMSSQEAHDLATFLRDLQDGYGEAVKFSDSTWGVDLYESGRVKFRITTWEIDT